MPKPRHILLPDEKARLKRALEERIGFALDGKPACIRASDQMRSEMSAGPSATTLHGLFVHAQEGRVPYLETLHILGRFLGYRDWHAFRQDPRSVGEVPVFQLDPEHALPDMLIACMRRQQFGVLDDLFDAWLGRMDHAGIYDVGLCVYVALYKAPDVAMPFYERYAGHPVVRTGFFELLADPQFRLHRYVEGLAQYRSATGAMDNATNFRDWLFAETMTFRHHVLKGEARAVEQGASLYARAIDEGLVDATHVFPATRYMMYALWYDVMQRRTTRRRTRERRLIEWAEGRLRKDHTSLERDILFYNLVDGFLHVKTSKEVLRDLLSLFPEVDPDLLDKKEELHRILKERDPNGLNARFQVG